MARNLLQRFFSILSARVITFALTIISTPILVRLLGSDGYGDYAFLIATFGILFLFCNFGTSQSLRKFFPEERDQENWKAIVTTFYLYLVVATSLLLVIIGVLFVESSLLASLYDRTLAEYMYYVIVFVLVSQLFSLCRAILMANSQEHRSEPLKVLDKVTFILIALGLLYIGAGVPGAMIGHIVGTGAAAVVALYFSRSYFDLETVTRAWHFGRQFDELVRFSFFSAIVILLFTSLYHIDVIMMRYFTDSATTGYYKAALVTAEFIWFVPYALQMLFIHSTSEHWSKNNLEKITTMTSQATRFGFLFTGLLAVGLASLGAPFLRVYFGPGFDQALIPLLILIPGAVGFALARPIYATNYAEGSMRPVIFATGVPAALNFVLNLLLIPQFGMVGAAVATTVGYGSMLVFHLQCSYSLGIHPTRDLRIGQVTGTVAITGIAVITISRSIDSDIIGLVVVPIVGGVVFLISVVATGAVSKRELKTIADSLG